MTAISEEEAGRHWCFQRGALLLPDPLATCIGGRCMAWRWFDAYYETANAMADSPEKLQRPEGEGWESVGEVTPAGGAYIKQSWRRPLPGRRGFCALAGRPDQER